MKAKDPTLAKPARPKILAYGKPGSGKTWWASDFPSCVMIDCEGGCNLPEYTAKLQEAGATYLGPEDGANDFQTVLDEVKQLATVQHDRKTLVIDSYSKLFNTAVQIEGERLLEAGERIAFANDRKPAVNYTRRLIRWLDHLDMNCLLICHEKALWQGGEEIGRTFDGWDKLSYELNLVVEVFSAGPDRKCRVVKTRFAQWPEGDVVDLTYEAFRERFGADVMEHTAQPIQLASTEEAELAERLSKWLDDDTRAKWFDKAGVSSWSEMDADTIRKCIKFMDSKLPQIGAEK